MAVNVVIHARDLNVSPQLREYVEKKAGKLDRYLPALTEVRVDLAETKSARLATDRQVAQLTAHLPGVVLRAEERKDDIFAAFDAVIDKMNRQIERYKGKRYRGRGDGASADLIGVLEEPAVELDGDDDNNHSAVVRRKRFNLPPMNEAEALEQMQLLSHGNFFVFYNADSNRVNVLYRRRDGDFGLIDPEVG